LDNDFNHYKEYIDLDLVKESDWNLE